MIVGSPATGLARPVYRLNPRVQLHWRQFGDDWVLFEALSGQTHQMSGLTVAVLMCYETGPPLSTVELFTTLGAEFGVSEFDVLQAASVLAVFDQLAALNLIIPVVSHVAV